MGPREELLRRACERAPDWNMIMVLLSTNVEMRDVVYGACGYLIGMEPLGISSILSRNLFPDVLTEAICYAEHLDNEAAARSVPCPSCAEPNDPELDCELFACKKCGKTICEQCASSGLCEQCDGVVHGTVTVRFR